MKVFSLKTSVRKLKFSNNKTKEENSFDIQLEKAKSYSRVSKKIFMLLKSKTGPQRVKIIVQRKILIEHL